MTFATARSTPAPSSRLGSSSRSSRASNFPVLAPLGTMARPGVRERSLQISTSTVGFPRLSKTSRACTDSMRVMLRPRLRGRRARWRRLRADSRARVRQRPRGVTDSRANPAAELADCLPVARVGEVIDGTGAVDPRPGAASQMGQPSRALQVSSGSNAGDLVRAAIPARYPSQKSSVRRTNRPTSGPERTPFNSR